MNKNIIIYSICTILLAWLSYGYAGLNARSNHVRGRVISSCKNVFVTIILDKQAENSDTINLNELSEETITDIKEIIKGPHRSYGEVTVYMKMNFEIDIPNKEIVLVVKDKFRTKEGHLIYNGPYTHVIMYNDGAYGILSEEEYKKIDLSEFIIINKWNKKK